MRKVVLLAVGLVLAVLTWRWEPGDGAPAPPKPRPANGLKVGIRWLEAKDVVLYTYEGGGDAGWTLEGRLVDDGTCHPNEAAPTFVFSGRLSPGEMRRPLRAYLGHSLYTDRSEICAPRTSDRLLVAKGMDRLKIIGVEDDVVTILLFATFETVGAPVHSIEVEGVLKARYSGEP